MFYVLYFQGLNSSITLVIHYLMNRENKNFKDSFKEIKELLFISV